MSANPRAHSKAPKTQHDVTLARCREFHARHPEVWNLFVRFAFELISAGHKHSSAAFIMGRIRWQSAIGDSGADKFRINNDFTPLYARKFEKVYPQYKGFFRSRKLASKTTPASSRPEFRPSDVVSDVDDDKQGGNS